MVGTVGHAMKEHLAAPHRALIAVDESEGHLFGERSIALYPRAIDNPAVYPLLCSPEYSKLGMNDDVARPEAVLVAFQVRLPDKIDDIDMVERAHDCLKEGLALLFGLARGSFATPSNVTLSAQAL